MLPREVPSRVRRPIALFPLEASEKLLYDRVTEAIPLSTCNARHLHAFQGMLIVLTRILTPSVRVIHQAWGWMPLIKG